MSLFHKIKFWVYKLCRLTYYHIRYRINKWIKIEGILFPVQLNYGYNVLRYIDNRKYESGEINIVKQSLHKNDKVLELGTGLGFISAFCSKKVGSENVYTFEANPLLKPGINKMYSRNHVNPHLEFVILGKENGIASFYVNRQSLLASGLHESVAQKQKIEVEQKNLNEKIREINPTYLIMDIEGGEYEIINEIDFHTISKVQFELHPSILDTQKISQIFTKLACNGFEKSKSLSSANNYYFFKKLNET